MSGLRNMAGIGLPIVIDGVTYQTSMQLSMGMRGEIEAKIISQRPDFMDQISKSLPKFPAKYHKDIIAEAVKRSAMAAYVSNDCQEDRPVRASGEIGSGRRIERPKKLRWPDGGGGRSGGRGSKQGRGADESDDSRDGGRNDDSRADDQECDWEQLWKSRIAWARIYRFFAARRNWDQHQVNRLTIYYTMTMMGAYCPEDGQGVVGGFNEKSWRKYLDSFEHKRSM
jgi:hypothetical protein